MTNSNTYANAAAAAANEAHSGFDQQPDMYVDPDVFSAELQKHLTAIYTLFNDALGEPVQDERFAEQYDLPKSLGRVMQAFGPAQTNFRGKGIMHDLEKAGKSSDYYRKQAIDEIGCEKLEQHNCYRRQLQQELAVWGVANQAAKEFYENLVGSEYKPYVKPNNVVKHLNSATYEAEQLAAKDKELKAAFG